MLNINVVSISMLARYNVQFEILAHCVFLGLTGWRSACGTMPRVFPHRVYYSSLRHIKSDSRDEAIEVSHTQNFCSTSEKLHREGYETEN